MSDPTGRAPTAFLMWIVQLFLTFLGAAHTFMSALSVASCGEGDCDYSAFAAALNTFYIGAVVLLVASGVAILLLRHNRFVILAPFLGIVLMITLLVITYVAGRGALTLPLFGNRLA